MPVQTYCTRAEVVSILSEAGLAAFQDDDENGVVSTGEAEFVADAIERTAGDMNAVLFCTYLPADLAGSAWCKWTNARLAAAAVVQRRLNPLPTSLGNEIQRAWELMERIAAGDIAAKVPDAVRSLSSLPTVTNFDVQRGFNQPVRVSAVESTGNQPAAGVKRPLARDPYFP